MNVSLELQDLARDGDRDLLRQVAVRDCGRHFGDVAHLRREIRCHRIHVVGQILPGAGDAGHLRLAAQAALRADLAGDAGHLAGESVQLIHHGVHGLFELENLTRDIDGDLVRQIAARNRGGHLRDRLPHPGRAGEIAAHRVHGIGQIHFQVPATPAPAPGRPTLAFRAHFSARHARDLRGEGAQLIDHRVDGFLHLQDFTAHIHGDFLRQVPIGHGDGHFRNIAHLLP